MSPVVGSLDLSYHRPDFPQVRPVLSRRNSADRALRRLTRIRLRLTLCRLAFDCGVEEMQRIAAAIDDPGLIVEVDDLGGLMILLVGPRRPNMEGDAGAEARILRRLVLALARCGHSPFAPDVRVAVAHQWSDALDGEATLLGALASVPALPLSNRRRSDA